MDLKGFLFSHDSVSHIGAFAVEHCEQETHVMIAGVFLVERQEQFLHVFGTLVGDFLKGENFEVVDTFGVGLFFEEIVHGQEFVEGTF